MGDHRVESTVLMIGGTAVLDAQRGRADDLVPQHLHGPRFTNPSFATQQHNLASTGLCLRPALAQERHLVLASYQRREAVGGHGIEAMLHLGGTYDLVDFQRRRHASERLGSERLASEIP